MILNPNEYPCEFDGYVLPESIKEETEESKKKLEASKESLRSTIASVKESARKRQMAL